MDGWMDSGSKVSIRVSLIIREQARLEPEGLRAEVPQRVERYGFRVWGNSFPNHNSNSDCRSPTYSLHCSSFFGLTNYILRIL